MKNILISGINGFIGKAIVDFLKDKYNIYGVDRQMECDNTFVRKYIAADISNFNDLKDSFFQTKVDHIIHCAAAITNNPNILFDSNIVGTWNIYLLAKLLACKSIVYVSSLPIIGTPIEHPVTESHPIYPESNYHLSKYVGELLLSSQKEMPVFTLRITSPIGKGMQRHTILPSFIRQSIKNEDLTICGEGSRRQDYIDVKDISSAVALALECDSSKAGIYNIASSKQVSNRELAEICKTTLKSSSEIVTKGDDPFDGIVWDISIEKAHQELGFSPQISLTQSVKEIAKYYENSDL